MGPVAALIARIPRERPVHDHLTGRTERAVPHLQAAVARSDNLPGAVDAGVVKGRLRVHPREFPALDNLRRLVV